MSQLFNSTEPEDRHWHCPRNSLARDEAGIKRYRVTGGSLTKPQGPDNATFESDFYRGNARSGVKRFLAARLEERGGEENAGGRP